MAAWISTELSAARLWLGSTWLANRSEHRSSNSMTKSAVRNDLLTSEGIKKPKLYISAATSGQPLISKQELDKMAAE